MTGGTYTLQERQLSERLNIPLSFFGLLRNEGSYVEVRASGTRTIKMWQPALLLDEMLVLIKVGELVEIQRYSAMAQMSIARALENGAGELIRLLGLPEIKDTPHLIVPLPRNQRVLEKIIDTTGYAKLYCKRLFLLFANGYTGDWGKA